LRFDLGRFFNLEIPLSNYPFINYREFLCFFSEKIIEVWADNAAQYYYNVPY
jgi:hypothetical protein